MKDVLIILKITLVGLFTAIVAYPLIHETGHILATILTGEKFISISWSPTPNVLCEMNSTDTAALAITSLSGMIFPMIIILPFAKSTGIIRLSALFVSGINVLAAVIGLLVVLLRMNGTVVQNDDITAFIGFTGWLFPALLIMIAMIIAAVLSLLLFKPRNTILSAMGLSSSFQKHKAKKIAFEQ